MSAKDTEILELTQELIRKNRAIKAARNLYAAVMQLGDAGTGPLLPVAVAGEQLGKALAAMDKEGAG